MTTRPTPTPEQFRDASWEDIRPLYQSLVDQELDPADVRAYASLATIFARQGRGEDAKAEFQRVADRTPGSVGALTMIGAILHSEGGLGEGQAVYEKVLAIKPAPALAARPTTPCRVKWLMVWSRAS